jgi:hypothetical protein
MSMMKVICLTLLMTSLGLLLVLTTSCSKKNNEIVDVVEVDTKEVVLTYDSPEKKITVTSSGEWYAQIEGAAPSYGGELSGGWFIVSTEFSDSDKNPALTVLSVSLKEGEDITSDKSATLKIIGRDNTETVSIKFSSN